MIPEGLKKLLNLQPKNVERPDEKQAISGLNDLGIHADSEFGIVYRLYRPGNFQSNTSDEFLCDIADPYNEVLEGTQFIHEAWELPSEFIAFTSLQGEGGYVIDKNSGKIWDFDLAKRKDFMSGNIPPAWDSFFEFITWYIS